MSAASFKMHQSTVAKLETGTRPTPAEELVALARILRVPLHQLVTPPPDDAALKRLHDAEEGVTEAKAVLEDTMKRLDRLMQLKETASMVLVHRKAELQAARSAMPQRGLGKGSGRLIAMDKESDGEHQATP